MSVEERVEKLEIVSNLTEKSGTIEERLIKLEELNMKKLDLLKFEKELRKFNSAIYTAKSEGLISLITTPLDHELSKLSIQIHKILRS